MINITEQEAQKLVDKFREKEDWGWDNPDADEFVKWLYENGYEITKIND